MRPLLTFLGAACAGSMAAAAPAHAQDCTGAGPVRLTVDVTGVRKAVGEVAVTVYPDKKARFLAPGGKLLRQRVKAAAPATTVCFRLPAPGSYALAVYHDQNADQDFNRDWRGLPAEGYGFSNDAPSKLGLPAFEAARVRVADGATLRIRMTYLR